MSSLEISFITLAIVFAGALLGIGLRAVLPEQELAGESREVVKLGMGLIATMAALVLGLLSPLPRRRLTRRIPSLRRCPARLCCLTGSSPTMDPRRKKRATHYSAPSLIRSIRYRPRKQAPSRKWEHPSTAKFSTTKS